MSGFRNRLLKAGAVVGVIFAATGFASSANAGIINFNFNYGLGSAANVNNLVLQDPSTIYQKLSCNSGTSGPGCQDGSAFGQEFTESGAFQVLTFKNSANSQKPLLGLGDNSLYFSFALSGHLDNNGQIVFNTPGSITLYLDPDGDTDPGNNLPATVLATFDVVQPSGSQSGFNFFNGQSGQGGIGLTVKQTGGNPNTFTDVNGNSLFGQSLNIVNAQPVVLAGDIGAPTFCPSASGFLSTDTCSVITTTSDIGSLQVSVPEPGSLALIGSALLGFGAIVRRRRKTTEA